MVNEEDSVTKPWESYEEEFEEMENVETLEVEFCCHDRGIAHIFTFRKCLMLLTEFGG